MHNVPPHQQHTPKAAHPRNHQQVLVDVEIAPPSRRLCFVAASVCVCWAIGEGCASTLLLAGMVEGDPRPVGAHIKSPAPPSYTTWLWRLAVAFGAWPCVILIVLAPLVPESPWLLVRRGRVDDGLRALKDLRGPFVDVSAEFMDALKASPVPVGTGSKHRDGNGGDDDRGCSGGARRGATTAASGTREVGVPRQG